MCSPQINAFAIMCIAGKKIFPPRSGALFVHLNVFLELHNCSLNTHTHTEDYTHGDGWTEIVPSCRNAGKCAVFWKVIWGIMDYWTPVTRVLNGSPADVLWALLRLEVILRLRVGRCTLSEWKSPAVLEVSVLQVFKLPVVSRSELLFEHTLPQTCGA